MKLTFKVLFAVALIEVVFSSDHHVILQQINLINGDHVEGEYKVKNLDLKEFNETAYVINSEFEILNDHDNSYSVRNSV